MQKDHKTKQIKPMLGLLAKFLLLGTLFFVLYQVQLKGLPLMNLRVTKPLVLIGAIGAIPLNLWLDWKRFQISLDSDLGRVEQGKAFFQGLIVGFFTPQIVAYTLGRMSFKNTAQNGSIVRSGALAGMAQFLITVGFAGFGALYLESLSSPVYLMGWMAVIFVLIVVYRNAETFFNRIAQWVGFTFSARPLPQKQKMSLLFYSFLRYGVFSFQFHMINASLGAALDLKVLAVLMLSYGLITLAPSLLFGKIIVRESIAVAVFAYYGLSKETVFVTALLTWLMNVVIPVLYAILILNKRWKTYSS